MRYGFYLPTRGACATADALEALLERGERLGFVSVMIADHVQTYARLGVSELVVDFRGDRIEESLERMERFAALVKLERR